MWIVSLTTFQQSEAQRTVGDEKMRHPLPPEKAERSLPLHKQLHSLFSKVAVHELILTDLFVGAVSFDNHHPTQYAPLQNPCYLGRTALEDECGEHFLPRAITSYQRSSV